MRAASFEYQRPERMDEALELLAQAGEDGRVLAGGQSLIPLMTLRLSRPRYVIDINRLTTLSFLAKEDGRLRIGALVRHHILEQSPIVAAHCPILAAAAGVIGDRQIRSRGTIGGSLAHADPAAELPMVMLALDGEIIARRRDGTRTIPVSEFFVTYMTTALEPAELLTEIRLPLFGSGGRWGFSELAFKPGGFAVGAAAVVIRLDVHGVCRDARIALAGVAPTAVRVPAAEHLLVGHALGLEAIEAAAEAVYRTVDPEGDVHASASYRQSVARVCIRRALLQAASQPATGE